MTSQHTAGKQLIKVPVRTNEPFNILVDIHGQNASQVDKVCIVLIPSFLLIPSFFILFSLLLQGQFLEYVIRVISALTTKPVILIQLMYDITQNQSAAIALKLFNSSITPLPELPVELLCEHHA